MQNIFDTINLPSTMTEQKINFLKNALDGGRGLNKNQIIPYFTSLIRKANEENISFSDEEVKFIILALRAKGTTEDNEKIDKLLSLKNN